MIVAIGTMDPTLQGIFFLVAVVLFLVAAFAVAVTRLNIVALGLAFAFFPFMWNAFAAA